MPRRARARSIGAVSVLLALTLAAIVLLRRGEREAGCCPAAGAVALDEPIASGLAFTLDSLPNGVRYYVRAHPSSGDRTELRLVIDAGSVQETEAQRGLAHAVEHMVFRGTRSFPGGAIERWFDAIGMRRGDDVNGTTSLDDTQYRMTVPTSRAGAIDTALAMLASMAHEATFDAADARRESGVLLEEWRSSRDADARVEDAQHPLLYAGTAYAPRPVLGDTGVLRRFDLSELRRYYETWYRPDLMAVIVVGDVEASEVETLVRRHFGVVPRRGARGERPALPGPAPDTALRATVVADDETQNSWIAVWHPGPRQRYRTRADYRAGLIVSLWQEVLRGRLEDAALQPESPLAGTSVERRTMSRAIVADVVSVVAMKGRTMPALEAMLAETRALAESGPTRAELEERSRALLHRARAQAQDGDASAALAAEFVDHFLTGNAVFTSRTAYELAREVLPTVSVEDIQAFARTRTADSGAVIVVAATVDDGVARRSADDVVARARSTSEAASHRSSEVVDVRRLLAIEPPSGRVVAEQRIRDVGVHEWTLSNGMRVLLKPTAFTFDEIQLHAVSPGGASLASDDAYASAYLADVVLGETGVGEIPAPRLRRWLAATSISLSPTVSDDAIALEGRTAPADLEAFFRLLHLYLTAPRSDTVAFRRYQARAASVVGDRERDPFTAFRDSVTTALAGGDPRALKSGPAFYGRVRLDQALDFWSRQAANGAGFTVALAGDFTLDRMRPLVERYLGSIPRGDATRPRDRGVQIPMGAVRRDLAAGAAERARTAIGFTAPLALSNENVNALGMVREVMARALGERLRERMGGTYYVDVSLGVDVAPPSRYTMTVEFESAPERVEVLAAAAMEELSRLRRHGPSAEQFQGARESLLRDYDDRMRDNGFWVGELTFHARHGWPIEGIAAHRDEVEGMTLEDVRRACATFIPAGGHVRVTVRPPPTARR